MKDEGPCFAKGYAGQARDERKYFRLTGGRSWVILNHGLARIFTDLRSVVNDKLMLYVLMGIKKEQPAFAGCGPRAFALVMTSTKAQVSYN